MTKFDFETEDQIESAFAEAVKTYAAPPGLKEAIGSRLFSPAQDLPSPSNARPTRWATHRGARYAAGLAVVASLLVALTIWGRHADLATGVAFADVQEAIRHVQSAIEVVDWAKTPWQNKRILFRSDCDVERTEWPSGMVWLRDTKQGHQLFLNPKNKTARNDDGWRGVAGVVSDAFATPREYLDNLAKIEQAAVKRLGQREFDGRNLIGFVLPHNKVDQGPSHAAPGLGRSYDPVAHTP